MPSTEMKVADMQTHTGQQWVSKTEAVKFAGYTGPRAARSFAEFTRAFNARHLDAPILTLRGRVELNSLAAALKLAARSKPSRRPAAPSQSKGANP